MPFEDLLSSTMAAKSAPPAEEKVAPRGNKNLDLALQQIAKDYGDPQ